MIQRSSRNPAIEPITIPAIAPPDSTAALSSESLTMVVVAWRGSTLDATSDSVLEGLICAPPARRSRISRAETADAGRTGAIFARC